MPSGNQRQRTWPVCAATGSVAHGRTHTACPAGTTNGKPRAERSADTSGPVPANPIPAQGSNLIKHQFNPWIFCSGDEQQPQGKPLNHKGFRELSSDDRELRKIKVNEKSGGKKTNQCFLTILPLLRSPAWGCCICRLCCRTMRSEGLCRALGSTTRQQRGREQELQEKSLVVPM